MVGVIDERTMTEFCTVDRTGWPSGPWDNEPDKMRWVDQITGLDCLIIRQRLGHLCGYVGVDPGHILYEKRYGDEHNIADFEALAIERTTEKEERILRAGRRTGQTTLDLELYVHGGVTFSDHIEDIDPEKWWFGFDCAHYNDISPSPLMYRNSHGVYRDIDYVQKEVERLAFQIGTFT